MEGPHDDELAVTIADAVREPNLAALELPLAVKPTKKGVDGALALIGGIEELSKVTADEERALKLHSRPKDPLCRPLVAQRNASEGASFVFKVKRRRLRPKSGPSLDDGSEGTGGGQGEGDTPWSIASVEAVGTVHTSFAFNTLADAQFVSCRPKDVGAEESIEEHIEAAAARSEPMELVPPSFLPPYTKVSQQSREEKILRREKKDKAHVKIERGGLLVYHRFGEAVKHRTKNGNKLMEDAKEVEHLREQLEKKWGAGRLRGRKNRPSRFRKGVSGHNEVREQQLLLVQKIEALFEKQPMYFMRQIEHLLQDQPVWPIRDLVPAVAYYYCNGPWRSRWVRFGYRPEDHPTDRFEQLLEFRVAPSQLRVWAEALDSKSGVFKISTPQVAATTGAKSSAMSATAAAASASSSKNGRATIAGDEGVSQKDGAGGGGSGGGDGSGEEDDGDNVANDPPEEGVQVAEAEREEDEEAGGGEGGGGGGGSGGGGGGGSREQGDGDMLSPGFAVGGVAPNVWLTSKVKGRFASQVVVNGGILTARNRVLVRESPIRAVQELALKSPRLDRPGIVTGWWQQSTIDAFRLLTLEGISKAVGFKKGQIAAADDEAASCRGAAQQQQHPPSRGGGNAKHPLPANMTREEFVKAMKSAEKAVKVVKVPTAAAAAAAAFGAGGAAEGQARKNKNVFPGTGGRSGTGRQRTAAGGKRPAPGGGGGSGGRGGDVSPDSMRSGGDGDGGDSAVLGSDEDTETDSVNSSDLVEDTEDEDSWNSQEDEVSDGDSDDDDDDDDDYDGDRQKTAGDGTRDKRPRPPQQASSGGDGGGGVTGGTARKAALPQKGSGGGTRSSSA